MGHAFNESYVEFGNKRQVNHCNKLFTAWDFNISNPKTADLKKKHIKTDFMASHFLIVNTAFMEIEN